MLNVSNTRRVGQNVRNGLVTCPIISTPSFKQRIERCLMMPYHVQTGTARTFASAYPTVSAFHPDGSRNVVASRAMTSEEKAALNSFPRSR
jgi:hypothetical protein